MLDLPGAAVHVWLVPAGHSDATLRTVLGRYLDGPPEALRISKSPRGKPFLAGRPDLRFNLSHSGSLAAVAVARREVGIDLERRRAITSRDGVARRVLTPVELARYEELDEARRTDFLLWAWARKEALSKAEGGGIGESMRRLACEPPPGSRWTVVDLDVPGFAAALAAEGDDWAPVLREDGAWPTSPPLKRSGEPA